MVHRNKDTIYLILFILFFIILATLINMYNYAKPEIVKIRRVESEFIDEVKKNNV